MAGEDTAVHAIAVGPIGQPPEVYVIPDPRVRDKQYELIAWFGEKLEVYYAECRARGVFPQFWVSSSGAAGHLDILADRLRFTRDAPHIKRTGELLTYATERLPVAGQQALFTATGALRAHYCTGQQESEDEHLGALLTWIQPPSGIDIYQAVQRAEQQVMGVKTDPQFDTDHLQPMLAAYHKAIKAGASEREMALREARIREALTPIVTNIYVAVQRALELLRGQFTAAPILDELVRTEQQTFEGFMVARDEGQALPYRDRPRGAAFKIAERELAIQSIEKGSIFGDTMSQARARIEGRILSGIVAGKTSTKVPRKTEHRFELQTEQTNLHMRAGDELAALHNPKLRCEIEHVERTGATTRVRVLVTAGMRIPGLLPDNGAHLELAAPPPDWYFLVVTRKKMSSRLAETPWTHGEAGLPPQGGAAEGRPNDLLAAVEALR